ncbi:anti-sigma factor [Rothia sp. AR01]|uniref:Anti-sigma factor n=1 Tax=Rothia santali TaxID=2949643 RepID=A0A9X2HIP7_9MICC|nr:anti-sigma factor [Rothia santali]MCP3425568.1 anti-sigma factor [Rothia santali]
MDEGPPGHPVRRPATVHSLDARRTRRNRWILAAAAAAVVPGVALGGWALGQQSAQQDQQVIAQEQQRQERLLAAPDVEVQRVQMDGGAATIFASRDRDAALLVASDFPDPGEGKQYQLWLLEDGTPVPDVTFDGGQSDVWASGDLAGVQAMAVTVEPAGGSEHPTTDPLMVADL